MGRKKTYKSALPKPDKAGRWRPYVGVDVTGRRVRFIIGCMDDTAVGEASRRLDSVRDIYQRQCSQLNQSHWDADALEAARKIAKGEPATVDWQHAKQLAKTVEQGLMQGKIWGNSLDGGEYLARLVHATGVEPADRSGYDRVLSGIKQLINNEVQQAVSNIKRRQEARYGQAVTHDVPSDVASRETRSLHDALLDHIAHLEATGNRGESGGLSPGYAKYIDQTRWLREQIDDCPLWNLNLDRIGSIVAHFRNRPVTRQGHRCSIDHAQHMIKRFLSFLEWLDNSASYQWSMPKGVASLKRVPVRLPQDRDRARARRITSQTYTPEQLAEECNRRSAGGVA